MPTDEQKQTIMDFYQNEYDRLTKENVRLQEENEKLVRALINIATKIA